MGVCLSRRHCISKPIVEGIAKAGAMDRLDHSSISLVVQFLGEPDSFDKPKLITRHWQQLYKFLCVSRRVAEWYSKWFDEEMDIAFHP